ncbi:conserved exported protein of unknown function [Hyphomicrobium sp. 1Nfss2.1]|uniref:hypothetical protein n=1 Tax=Hyphomicrobium sp. 1Nfss2.1 TaxID=3413936 RepID=UPI003C7DFF1A
MSKPVLVALIAALAVPCYVAPVSASDYWDWSMGSGSPTTRTKKARVRHAKRYKKEDPTRVMGYVKREDEMKTARPEVQCTEKVRGLGTQWIGTEGAMDAAKKDWMERVRYDYGESFLDLSHAKDFVSRCGRTSIGETMGQVMYRCEIVARPCKGVMSETTAAVK